MPFDDLIHRPNYVTTRAVTVDASPDVVWPLLRDLRPLPTGTLIRREEEKRWIAYAPPEPEAEATWVVKLEPIGPDQTRIVSRVRARFPVRAASIAKVLIVDPAQFVIERRWLLGLRKRAGEARKSRPST
jgi:hypothetical protein